MKPSEIKKLRQLTNFDALIDYLRDELNWPIEVEDAEDIVFDYAPDELGIDPKNAVKIESIKQMRPLISDNQPWGIFYIEFESKRLPVVVLRRILHSLVKRTRNQDVDRPTWQLDDLLFISAQGDAHKRSVSFAHFRQTEGKQPELRTFSWDSDETHFYYLQNFNLEALRWPDDEDDVDEWRAQWRKGFTKIHRYTITKSQELATEMARQARIVRDLVNEVYRLEGENDPLHQLFESFKKLLLHDLTPDSFADMVAQTITYGLFSAAAENDKLTYDDLVDSIPPTNPFLRDLLDELTGVGGIDLEEVGVGQLLDLLNQTDLQAILQDFGRQTGSGKEDPVIHFYEAFLTAYDKEQKVQRGVFYTPDPVVSYIVRSVDELIKTEFGLEDGLASTAKDPDTGEYLVQILDPATGTGTFLAHVIDVIEATVKGKGEDWNQYVAQHLLPRLYGFELMMAPYAVAHMKLGLKLKQTGYKFQSNERLRVYLTNALEEPVEMSETLAFAGFLSKEADEAARVKKQAPITVVIGNPPYAVTSINVNEWIENLTREYYFIDDVSLGERNPKVLLDDYVKFIRFSQWCITQTGKGIVALITNHGYLDNPTFRGMRYHLNQSFSKLYLLDLHGNSRKQEDIPDRINDRNVFDIQQGVAIGFFIKKNDDVKRGSQIYHQHLWGTREYKYNQILNNTLQMSQSWKQINSENPYFLFIPQSSEHIKTEYKRAWKVTDIFVLNSVNLRTHRDHFAIDFDFDALETRVKIFGNPKYTHTEIAKMFSLKDTRDWKLANSRVQLQKDSNWMNKFSQCCYRPFDIRWIYYDGSIVEYPSASVLQNFLRPNVGFSTTRQTTSIGFQHILAHKYVTEYKFVSHDRNTTAFPLYEYPQNELISLSEWETSSQGRRPNLSYVFVKELTKKMAVEFVFDVDLAVTDKLVEPEDIFHYIYAIFHSPTYRTRYAEFLKIDFPRLPLTSNLDLFRTLVHLGGDLVGLHLLEADYEAASWVQAGELAPWLTPVTTFVEGSNGTTMGKFSKRKCYEDGKVYLDTGQRKSCSYFDGVPEDVWNFHIGGYQVLYKWLYDRRGKGKEVGRTLTAEDIAHYQHIVVSLQETMRLMVEIDEVIEEHGGWPIE